MADAGLRLDDQLCFALGAATNAVTRAYRPFLADLGITYPQYLALMALWQHGSAPVPGLAARLDLPAQQRVVCATGLDPRSLDALRDSRHALVEDLHVTATDVSHDEGKPA